MKVKITIDRVDKPWREGGFEVECELVYHPGLRGARDKFGVPLEPDDEPYWEFIEAIDEFGSEVELTKEEIARAEEIAAESREPACNEDDPRKER